MLFFFYILQKLFNTNLNKIVATDNGQLWEDNLPHRNDELLPEIEVLF